MRTRKRDDERFACDTITCPLGEVVDVSATGMRVRVRQGLLRMYRVGMVLPTPLDTPYGRISIRSRVVRVRRTGLRWSELGLCFVKPPFAISRILQQVAKYGFVPPLAQDQAGTGGGPVSRPPHYQTLGIDADSSDEHIHAAYRTLVRKYHPDRNPSPECAQRFEVLTQAYRVLRDPTSRRQYDQACGLKPPPAV